MKRVVIATLWAIICFPFGVAYPQAQTAVRVISGHEELTGPTVWVYQSISFEKDSSVRTNGHPLSITILGDLTVRGEATIYSFSDGTMPPKPPTPRPAPDGRSFDPGPGSEGSGAPGPTGGP